MVLHRFPDIEFVRRLTNDPARLADKWMNVALNIKCREVSRTGVESPYSIFLNKKGFSYCKVGKMSYRVDTQSFLLATPGEIYDLHVDNHEQTEICNAHMNRDFFHQAAYSLMSSSAELLQNDCYFKDTGPQLFSQLYVKDMRITELAAQLCAVQAGDSQRFEDILVLIIEHILLSNDQVRKKIASLPFLSEAVRTDIYRRISQARDYLHSNFDKTVELNDLCREIGMSKFHFLRVFKSHYKVTPHQYLTQVRMNKAHELLKQTQKPIVEIAGDVGFEYPGSFIKAFHKRFGYSPLQYRKQ